MQKYFSLNSHLPVNKNYIVHARDFFYLFIYLFIYWTIHIYVSCSWHLNTKSTRGETKVMFITSSNNPVLILKTGVLVRHHGISRYQERLISLDAVPTWSERKIPFTCRECCTLEKVDHIYPYLYPGWQKPPQPSTRSSYVTSYVK